MRPLRLALAVALLLLLAACGSDEGDAPSVREALPACTDIWVAGSTLPADFDGKCLGGEDTLQVAEVQPCTESDRQFTTYDARFFAILGDEIHDDGFTSGAYTKVFFACFGTDW